MNRSIERAILLLSLLSSCAGKTSDRPPVVRADSAIANHIQQPSDTTVQTAKRTGKRELRYLFFANGGIRAFFDDGTIVGCPRCDYCMENIAQMRKAKPFAKYIVQQDGSLLVDNKTIEHPEYDRTAGDGWAMIDYKWYIRPPRCDSE